ncbi:MAG: alkaline phosphatase PhoX [Thermoleophilaceae bacterium]
MQGTDVIGRGLSRRRFVQGSAAVGGSLALAGPLEALAAQRQNGRARRGSDYGQLRPTPERDSGLAYLALPPGFTYRIISRQAEPMSDGNPTPGIFDGMAAYLGPGGQTILIRNHENRSRPGEIPVVVPRSMRYDQDPEVRGGNTKLVVERGGERRVRESFAVLGGTHTNCAGGLTPWRTWITCEEIFVYGSNSPVPGSGTPHGYSFEVPVDTDGPVQPLELNAAGRFSHEAVAWLDGALYETEDRGDAALYRFLPNREPREHGDLASFGGTLEALVVRGRPNFAADSANPGERYPVEWVAIEEPDPLEDTVRAEAQSKGAAIFDRTEGIWTADRRVYFDCTSGGEAELGQVWEHRPRGRGRGELRLVYESTDPAELESPDNLVVVPATGDVFLQEDGDGQNFVRGVSRRGEIYDFAATLLSDSEFCGGCFSPDARTFFLNQQGGRQADPLNPPNDSAAVTYAIWGPFDRERRGDDDDRGRDDDRRDH